VAIGDTAGTDRARVHFVIDAGDAEATHLPRSTLQRTRNDAGGLHDVADEGTSWRAVRADARGLPRDRDCTHHRVTPILDRGGDRSDPGKKFTDVAGPTAPRDLLELRAQSIRVGDCRRGVAGKTVCIHHRGEPRGLREQGLPQRGGVQWHQAPDLRYLEPFIGSGDVVDDEHVCLVQGPDLHAFAGLPGQDLSGAQCATTELAALQVARPDVQQRGPS